MENPSENREDDTRSKENGGTGCSPSALADLQKAYDELHDRFLRLAADFDNYRKRFDKEKEQIISLANETLLADLLVVIDDFERALCSVQDEKNREGLAMLQKNFYRILESHGLRVIDPLGKRFDPNFHEVLCKEVCDTESGIILEVYQKGYLVRSRVIRPSRVKIAENVLEKGGEP
jgi:molecular chaperone GrpE